VKGLVTLSTLCLVLAAEARADGVKVQLSSSDATFTVRGAAEQPTEKAVMAKVENRIREVLWRYLPYWNFAPSAPDETLFTHVCFATNSATSKCRGPRSESKLHVWLGSSKKPWEVLLFEPVEPFVDLKGEAWIHRIGSALERLVKIYRYDLMAELREIPIAEFVEWPDSIREVRPTFAAVVATHRQDLTTAPLHSADDHFRISLNEITPGPGVDAFHSKGNSRYPQLRTNARSGMEVRVIKADYSGQLTNLRAYRVTWWCREGVPPGQAACAGSESHTGYERPRNRAF
jgi:hypothetical protein